MSQASVEADKSAILDSFASSADTYERRIGRATRAVAAHIVNKTLSGLPSEPVVHDNACGTGALTDEVLKVYPKAQIEATDAAAPMVDIVNAQTKTRGLAEQVNGSVMDGAELTFPDSKFDASVTNFGIFFLPDPLLGAKEIYRTLRPGGTAVLTCWENLDLIYGIFVDAEKLVRPEREFTRPDFLLKWKEKGTMEVLLGEAGFQKVEMENVKVLFWGHDIDDLAGGLGENMKGFVGENYSKEEKERCVPCVKEYLESEGRSLLVREDAKLGVRMSAWVAKAIK